MADAGVIVGVVVGVVVLAIVIAVLIYWYKCRKPPQPPRPGEGHVIGNLDAMDNVDKTRVNGLQNSQKQPNDGQMIIMNPAALELEFEDGYKKHGTGLVYQVGDNRDIVTDEPTVFKNTAMRYDNYHEERVTQSLRRATPYQETDNTAVISNTALGDVTVTRKSAKETAF